MHRTTFAGLTAPEPGDSPQVDGSSFFTLNPDVIDRFLSIGAVTHRHDAHAPLQNPVLAPSASVVASGGTIGPSQDFNIGYTLVDALGGETMLSQATTVSTVGPEPPPQLELTGSADYTAGFLVTADYGYAITHQTAAGIETGLGPVLHVNRDPGFASGQIHLAGLSAELDPDHAVEWRLWRSINGGVWRLLAEGTSDTYTDNGSVIPDADNTQQPPSDFANSIQGANQISVTLPAAGSGAQQEPAIASAAFIMLYVSQGGFQDPCLYNIYPVASAGVTILIPSFQVVQGSPPAVNRSIPGAHKIDPDTEILDWHWKRPVASASMLPSGTTGDARVVIFEKQVAFVLGSAANGPADWTLLNIIDTDTGGGGGSGTVRDFSDGAGDTVHNALGLKIVASGEISAGISASGGSAVLTLWAATDSGGGGGSGAVSWTGDIGTETASAVFISNFGGTMYPVQVSGPGPPVVVQLESHVFFRDGASATAEPYYNGGDPPTVDVVGLSGITAQVQQADGHVELLLGLASGASATIEANGVPVVPQRSKLNFIGKGVSVFDDGVGATVIDIGDPPLDYLGCVATTISNINLASSPAGSDAAFDGYTLTNAGADRVLVRAQTDPIENGIYIWNGAAAALTRVPELAADGSAMFHGATVWVREGTTKGSRMHVLNLDVATVGYSATIGADALHFLASPAYT